MSNMVLKVVATLHQETAEICGYNLSSICGGGGLFRGGDEEVVVVAAEREIKTVNFTETTLPRGFFVDKVLREVMSDSDSKDEFSHSDDDVHSSSESESAGAYLRSGSESMRPDSNQAAHASPQGGRGGSNQRLRMREAVGNTGVLKTPLK